MHNYLLFCLSAAFGSVKIFFLTFELRGRKSYDKYHNFSTQTFRTSPYLVLFLNILLLKVKSLELRRCNLLFGVIFVKQIVSGVVNISILVKIKTSSIFSGVVFWKFATKPRSFFQVSILTQGTWPLLWF